MKRITIIAILIAAVLSASAQGEWKWANYWTGNDDPLNSNNPYNYVVRTAFDDDGNVYVYGCFGGNAKLYAQDTSVWFCDDVAVILANTKGCALMKFDSSGNLLWKRTIKKSSQGECLPYDMVLHNDRILISGQYDLAYGSEDLWFLDTLITQQTAFDHFLSGEIYPPYSYTDGINTFISILDLDGNVLENHFAKVLSRAIEDRFASPINSGFAECRMCVDSYGNIYMATGITYGGPDTLPWTVVIDEDTAKTYDLYLPGYMDMPGINNMMLFKFSQNFELIGAKLIVDHTVGVSPYIPVDTVNPSYLPYVLGLSIDDEDNLYLSGTLTRMFYMHEYNQYPMRFYWDSTHYATADDYGLEYYLPFIIKYDSDGNVLWSNQAYVRNPNSMNNPNTISWTDNVVEENSVYLVGLVEQFDGSNALYYFDNENNAMNVPHYTTCFVRFDKSTGQFQCFEVTPGEKTAFDVSDNGKPAIVNNHLMMMPRNYLVTDCYYLLCYFNIDGTFDRADTIHYVPGSHFSTAQNVITDHNGHILCDVTNSQDLTFGHDFTLSFDDHTRSHAVVAYRYDPSILVPYPEDSVGIAQFSDMNTPISLYPNPASNEVTVTGIAPEEVAEITVLTMQGSQVANFRNVHRFNISRLAPASYIVRVATTEGKVHYLKLVKQ